MSVCRLTLEYIAHRILELLLLVVEELFARLKFSGILKDDLEKNVVRVVVCKKIKPQGLSSPRDFEFKACLLCCITDFT